MLLFWLKPFDFPDRTALCLSRCRTSATAQGRAWQPVLEAGWVFFPLGSAAVIPQRVVAGTLGFLCTVDAAPYILIVTYAQTTLSQMGFRALARAAWLASFIPVVPQGRKKANGGR